MPKAICTNQLCSVTEVQIAAKMYTASFYKTIRIGKQVFLSNFITVLALDSVRKNSVARGERMRLNLKTKCLTLLFKKIRITDDETLKKLLLLLVRSTFALFFRS